MREINCNFEPIYEERKLQNTTGKKKKKMRQDRLNFKQIRSACENKYN